MINQTDLELAENAMKKSKERIGYCLVSISGKRLVSSISIEEIFEQAEKEAYLKHLIVFCEDENKFLNKVKIDKIKDKINKNFVIYFATKNEIKEYKI